MGCNMSYFPESPVVFENGMNYHPSSCTKKTLIFFCLRGLLFSCLMTEMDSMTFITRFSYYSCRWHLQIHLDILRSHQIWNNIFFLARWQHLAYARFFFAFFRGYIIHSYVFYNWMGPRCQFLWHRVECLIMHKDSGTLIKREFYSHILIPMARTKHCAFRDDNRCLASLTIGLSGTASDTT